MINTRELIEEEKKSSGENSSYVYVKHNEMEISWCLKCVQEQRVDVLIFASRLNGLVAGMVKVSLT